MWKHNYCCCAIPLYKVGALLISLELLVICAVVGGLAVGGPSVLSTTGIGTSAGPIVWGVAGFVTAAIQLVMVVAILNDQPRLGRTASWGTLIALLVMGVVGAVWFILDFVKLSDAKTQCVTDLWKSPQALTGKAEDTVHTVCNILATVDAALLTVIWGILVVSQGYFLYYLRTYNHQQINDMREYKLIASGSGASPAAALPFDSTWGYPNADRRTYDDWAPAALDKELPVISPAMRLDSHDTSSDEHIEMAPYNQGHYQQPRYSDGTYAAAYPAASHPYSQPYHATSSSGLMQNPQYAMSGFVNDYDNSAYDVDPYHARYPAYETNPYDYNPYERR